MLIIRAIVSETFTVVVYNVQCTYTIIKINTNKSDRCKYYYVLYHYYYLNVVHIRGFLSRRDEQQAIAARPVSGSRDNVVARRFSRTRVVYRYLYILHTIKLYVEDHDIPCEMISKGFIIFFFYSTLFFKHDEHSFLRLIPTIFIDMHDICTAVSAYELQLPRYAGVGATMVLPSLLGRTTRRETKNTILINSI